MQRLAFICINFVERLLRFEMQSRVPPSADNVKMASMIDVTMIAVITRLTRVAAILLRYVDAPHPLRQRINNQKSEHTSFNSIGGQVWSLPLGQGALSILTRKIDRKARMMIRRDQLFRFGDVQCDGGLSQEMAPEQEKSNIDPCGDLASASQAMIHVRPEIMTMLFPAISQSVDLQVPP